MKIELSEDDLSLIKLLLEKDLGETRVGIHHCKNHEYKEWLKTREAQIHDLIGRFERIEP